MDTELRDQLIAATAASFHPLVRSWYDEAELVANAEAALRGEFRLIDDAESAREFQRACPVPGREAREYGNRVVALGDGLYVVAGIRFRRGDTLAPWIDVVAVSRPVADGPQWQRIATALAAEFSGFAPRRMGFYSADEGLELAGRMTGDIVVVARVEDLRVAPQDESVALRRVGALASYDHYLNLYRAFHAERPVNAELAHVEDIETMAKFETDRGLFEVRIDGMFAGYCASRRSSRFGIRGWVGGEIILSRRFRGLGHAAAVHRRMACEIDAAPGDALWATVHEDNAPSLRAGLRAGYAVIGRGYRVAVG